MYKHLLTYHLYGKAAELCLANTVWHEDLTVIKFYDLSKLLK